MPTLLRLATAGSVDDGKSTLVGRLLHDTKSVLADQLAAVERVSRDRGLTAADLALLTDGLRAEREQGITIDVAYRYFATAQRSFILADCPGHVQYTRNMVTAAAGSDARGEGGLEHLARLARVAHDQNLRGPGGRDAGRGPAQAEGEIGTQKFARDPADTVRAEKRHERLSAWRTAAACGPS